MDPVSHVVIGRAVVAALDRHDGSMFGRGAGAAAIGGALVPDIDFVLMPAGWDIYLRWHAVGTHSIAGACALGCGAGLVLHGMVRGSRLAGLAAAAAIAALTHLVLDLLSGAELGLAWPLWHTRFALPLVAMAEPWLVALLAAVAIAMWTGNRWRTRRTARMVLLATAMFFAFKAALYWRATAAIAADPRTRSAAARALEARWGSWSMWNLYEKNDRALQVWEVSGRSGLIEPLLTWPIADDPPLAAVSRSFDTVDNFLSVHNLTLVVARRREEGRTEVLWSDLRYCRQGLPAGDGIDCALWFGVLFDDRGGAIKQVVHVGNWIQTRPPSR